MKILNLSTLVLLLVGLFGQSTALAQCTAQAGTLVQTPDGNQRVYTCPGDGQADIVNFSNTSTSNADFAYVVTDANNTILAVNVGSSFDFEVAPPGNCLVWGFSYNGNITAQMGESVFSTRFSDNCWFISNNAIEVVRDVVDGGEVATPTGATSVSACLDDGVDDYVAFTNNSTSNARYAYVITDDNNIILGLPSNSFANFSGAGIGICRVWGLSYTGNLTAQMGDNAAAIALSDGCFALSSNFIEVIRNNTDGGTVSTPSGDNRVDVCVGNGTPDVVEFAHQSTSSADYAYVITDGNNNILVVNAGSSFDFDVAPPGLCRVFGFSYTGTITAQPGDLVYTTRFSDGCYRISSNAIEVYRDNGPTAGNITTNDPTSICVDGNPDPIDVTVSGASGGNSGWIITDDNNNILALPPAPPFDLDGAGVGVCLIWYIRFEDGLTGLMTGNNVSDVAGCFDLSNSIRVDREAPDGGMVSLANGETTFTNCAGDIVLDVMHTTASPNLSYWYIITDDNDNILEFANSANTSTLDLSAAPPGVCRIWGWSYRGLPNPVVGENISTLTDDDCEAISDNFITVNRTDPAIDGGTVAMPSGATTRYTCPGDGIDDIVMFTNSTTSSANYAYVITDDNNVILGLPPGNSQNFEGAGVGVCRVWGLSFTGNITAQMGDNAATTELTDGCFQLSENFIEVIRDNPDGGTVAMPSGATTRYTCPGDGIDDIVEFTRSTSSLANYAYVVTDDNNIILGLPPGNSLNFEGAGTGVCRVWGLSYTGMVTAQVGDDAAAVALSSDCFDLSDNFIEVIRDNPDGGTVAMPSGATTRYTCPGDGIDDIVEFTRNTSSLANYAYVVTDDNNIILGLPPGNSLNFEGAGTGVCRVWGLSYTGMVTAQVGDDAAAVALSSDCFDLSDNFIEVIRDNPDGGTVAMPSGATTRYTCPGDGIDDIVEFTRSTNSLANYAYVVTDDNNIILGLPPGNSLNFEGAGTGVCRVWGLSYTGMVTAQVGDDAAAVALSSDCFDLSDNFIEVIRDNPDGGTVAMPSGATTRYTCPGDGIDDIVEFTRSTNSLANYAYVVTDDNNIILGLPPGNSLNFEGAGTGVCRVWGLSYTGMVTAQVGDDAAAVALSSDCFDLSDNFIEVIRDNPDGGTVAMPSGATTRYTCPGDGIDDIVEFTRSTSSLANYAYVVTDDNNIILGLPPGNSLNFEGAGTGVCRVWGLSYTGMVTAQVGDDAAAVALSSDCFDLSDNFIEVIRDNPDGGTVAMPSGATTRYTCPGDGIDDIVEFTRNTSSLANYAYVVTDDNNIILGLPPGNSLNFEGAGTGVCRVWGLSYTGMVTAQVGDDAAAVALSSDCFDLSDNFIEVIRDNPDGGTVEMPDGNTEITTCAGDGEDDIVEFTHATGSLANYTYVITDDNNIILGLPPGNSQNFEGAGTGVCRVWGLSYTGMITAEVGDDAAAVDLSSDCFELSENFITVNREDCFNFTDPNSERLVLTNQVFVQPEVQLSPNPASDYLRLTFEHEFAAEDNAVVAIYSLEGRLLFQQNIAVNEGYNNTEIQLTQLPEGLYILRLRGNNLELSKRFVKN